MAITTPKGEQIQFVSSKTGTHNLDTYLEAAEVGNRQLSDLLDDMFDTSTGVFKADNFEFRFNATDDKIQVRVGQFANSGSGWTDVTTFFSIEGAFSTSTSYNNFDIVTVANGDGYIVHGLASAQTFGSESAFTSSANTYKLIDVSGAQDWATKTSGAVSGSDYSSKEYAQGTQASTGGSAKSWAQDTNQVDGASTNDRSAKAWAQGASMTGSTLGGSSKDWAQHTGSTVDGTNYSAKHWATTSNVSTVASGIGNINIAAGGINNIDTVAGQISPTNNIGTLAGISNNITTVAGKASLITADFASDMALIDSTFVTKINLVTSDFVTDMNLVTADFITDLNLVTADFITDLNLVTADFITDLNLIDAGFVTKMNLVTSDFITDMNLVTADFITDLNLVTPDFISDMNLVTSDFVTDMSHVTADFVTDMNLVTADFITDANTLGTSANVTNMATLGASGVVTNIGTVAGAITNINTTATNIAGVNSFAERYRTGSSDPSSSLDEGDLFYNSTSNTLKFYNGSSWQSIPTVTLGIANGNVLSANANVADNDYLKIDGTSVEGRTVAQLTEDLIGANNTLVYKDTNDDVILTSTDTNANTADPRLIFYRQPSSPADWDYTGGVYFRGVNDNNQYVDYASIISRINDVSDNSEDGTMYFRTLYNGTNYNTFQIGNGYIQNNFPLYHRHWEPTIYIGTNDYSVTSGDILGRLLFNAYQESSGGIADDYTAEILAEATASFTSTVNTSDLVFKLSTSGTRNERLRLKGSGSSAFTGDVDIDGQLDVSSSTGGIIELQRIDTSISSGESLGKLQWRAPNESSGTDAIESTASIEAVANSSFTTTINKTDMVFNLANNGAPIEVMRLHHEGDLTLTNNVNNSNYGPVIKLMRDQASGTNDDDLLGTIDFWATNTSGTDHHYASIYAKADDGSNNSEDGSLRFKAAKVGGAASAEPDALVLTHDVSTFNTKEVIINSDNSDHLSSPLLKLVRNSASPSGLDDLGSIRFYGDDSGGDETLYAWITGASPTVTAGSESGGLEFSHRTGNSVINHLTLKDETATFAGNIKIKNAGTIGSVGDADALSISSGGVVDFTQQPTVSSAKVKVAGKETIWIPAAAMYPTTTNGCAALAQVELSNGPELKCLDFDDGSDEYAQFTVGFPKSWDLGTVTFKAYWCSSATDTDGVTWSLQACGMGDSYTANLAFGTAVPVDDASQGTANTVLITAESSPITIAGTPADEDLTFFQIFRDVSDSNDTATEDARLLGIKLYFTTNKANDA